MTTFRLRVPASIANLGPGFDVLAMAIDLWLSVEARPADKADWRFEGADPPPGHPFETLRYRGRIRSSIPLGVGLGSSAAARVAALRLAGVAEAELLATAAQAEGHPDNAAAAIHGGLVAVVEGRVHHLPVPDLEIGLFVAGEPTPTEEARAVLSTHVPREDAVHNAGRLALLVHTLHTRDWALLRSAMEDRLHQPARSVLYPWLGDVLEAAYSAGAWGAALAGAGPSVFAFTRRAKAQEIAERMAGAAGCPGTPITTRIAKV